MNNGFEYISSIAYCCTASSTYSKCNAYRTSLHVEPRAVLIPHTLSPLSVKEESLIALKNARPTMLAHLKELSAADFFVVFRHHHGPGKRSDGHHAAEFLVLAHWRGHQGGIQDQFGVFNRWTLFRRRGGNISDVI